MDQFWSQEYKLPSNVEKEFAWYRISNQPTTSRFSINPSNQPHNNIFLPPQSNPTITK